MNLSRFHFAQVVFLLSDIEVHSDKVQSDYRVYNTSYPRGFLNQHIIPTFIRLGYSPPDIAALQMGVKGTDVVLGACDALLSDSGRLIYTFFNIRTYVHFRG